MSNPMNPYPSYGPPGGRGGGRGTWAGPPHDDPRRGDFDPRRDMDPRRDFDPRRDMDPRRGEPPLEPRRGDMMQMGHERMPPVDDFNNYPHHQDFPRSRDEPPPNRYGGGGAPPPPPPPQKPVPPPEASGVNDCEIITLASPDPNYVNMVENAIKEFGLKVDVMIPRPTVKMSSFISNLAMKGTIFAVVIRPDNVEHRSVSVHVLRGPPKPEEHRNMPLSTAYSLIQKCYLDLKKKEIGGIPDDIKVLMRYLLEDRTLTDKDYAVVIAFLQDRRKRQSSFDGRQSFDAGITNVGGSTMNVLGKSISSPEELQQRILKIIAGAESGSRGAPAAAEPVMGTVIDHGHSLSSPPIRQAAGNPPLISGGGQPMPGGLSRPYNL